MTDLSIEENEMIDKIMSLARSLSPHGIGLVTHKLVNLITRTEQESTVEVQPKETFEETLPPHEAPTEPSSSIPQPQLGGKKVSDGSADIGADSSGSESSDGGMVGNTQPDRGEHPGASNVGGDRSRRVSIGKEEPAMNVSSDVPKKRRRRRRKNRVGGPANSNNHDNVKRSEESNRHQAKRKLPSQDLPPKKKPQFTIRYITDIEPVSQLQARYLNNTAGGFSTPATPDEVAEFKSEFGSEFFQYGSMSRGTDARDDFSASSERTIRGSSGPSETPEALYGDWMTSPPRPETPSCYDYVIESQASRDAYLSSDSDQVSGLPPRTTSNSRRVPMVPDWSSTRNE